MAEKFEFVDHGKYLEVIFTGERTYEEVVDLIKGSYVKCNETRHKKILVNMLGAKGPWLQIDRFKVGEQVAQLFRGTYRILVVEHEYIINKFAENTAANRGVNIVVTHEKEVYLDWLLADGHPR